MRWGKQLSGFTRCVFFAAAPPSAGAPSLSLSSASVSISLVCIGSACARSCISVPSIYFGSRSDSVQLERTLVRRSAADRQKRPSTPPFLPPPFSLSPLLLDPLTSTHNVFSSIKTTTPILSHSVEFNITTNWARMLTIYLRKNNFI